MGAAEAFFGVGRESKTDPRGEVRSTKMGDLGERDLLLGGGFPFVGVRDSRAEGFRFERGMRVNERNPLFPLWSEFLQGRWKREEEVDDDLGRGWEVEFWSQQ